MNCNSIYTALPHRHLNWKNEIHAWMRIALYRRIARPQIRHARTDESSRFFRYDIHGPVFSAGIHSKDVVEICFFSSGNSTRSRW